MRANYRLEYYDRLGKRHDTLIRKRDKAEQMFREALKMGATEAVLSQIKWVEILSWRG